MSSLRGFVGESCMITIDSRVGSRELLPYFPKNTAVLSRLEYADASFIGQLGSETVSIGVERKAMSDLLSSMQTGRLAGVQLRGLLACYDVTYLVLEGIYRPGQDGLIMVPRGRTWVPMTLGRRRYSIRELDSFLNTIAIETGLQIRQTGTLRHTAMLIYNLYNWWQKREHTSHLAMHKNRFVDDGASGVLLGQPSLLRRFAAELPGVGWKRSKDVAEYFGNIKAMVAADEKEWRKVAGIGKVLAERIVGELHGTS